MKLTLNIASTGGHLSLCRDEEHLDRQFFSRDRDNKYFTIAWNLGGKQTVTIDGTAHEFLPDTILPLMFNQSFYFERPADVVAWQFNREFYCIVDHDAEVSCVGFLFGMGDNVFTQLEKDMQEKLQLMLRLFVEEFRTADQIQHDMLLMLLKRLIIIITQLARSKYTPGPAPQDERFHIFRKFNLLVEGHYREEHTVGYYAQRLSRSPKTLSNLFSLYNQKSPLQIIQDRILIEAKRLLYYTNKSVKQITYELGFEDAAYFSNFFKRHTSLSPQDFRNEKVLAAPGK
jgi:AraC-like DNA-binding protein